MNSWVKTTFLDREDQCQGWWLGIDWDCITAILLVDVLWSGPDKSSSAIHSAVPNISHKTRSETGLRWAWTSLVHSGTPQFSLQLQYMGWISTQVLQLDADLPWGIGSAATGRWEKAVWVTMWDTWQGRVVNPLFWGWSTWSTEPEPWVQVKFQNVWWSSIDFHSEELHQWSCKSKGEVRTVPQGINASWIQRICDLNVNWPFCSLLSSYWAHQTILTLKLSDMFDPL